MISDSASNRIRCAVDAFCKNPHWRKLLNEAPSDAAKDYVRLTFCNSHYGCKDCDAECSIRDRNAIFERFTHADWEFCYRTSPNCPLKTFFKKKAEETENQDDLLSIFQNMKLEDIDFSQPAEHSYEDWWKDFAYDESSDEDKVAIENYLFKGVWENDDEDA